MNMISEARKDDVDWRHGRLFGLVYFFGEDLLRVATDVYSMFLSESASKPQNWPSLKRFETDIIGMVSRLFHGGEEATGNVTSGGTESIFLAVKAVRDWARANRPTLESPEIALPRSAHPAFDRSAQYLGLKVVRVPVHADLRADVRALGKAITGNTVMIVGSAPGYPHGVVDSVRALGELAEKWNLWLHVDACHGFLAPFVKELGYPVTEFDFAVPSVTTISVDLHKWGFAPKGASVILHRDAESQKYQWFDFSDWQGGRYRSLTFTGTRTGGSVAAAWAVMNYLGQQGYLKIAKAVMETKRAIIQGINAIDGLQIFGEPELGIITFGSQDFDIFAVADGMDKRKWVTARSSEPPGMHLVISPAHARIVDEFLKDLTQVVRNVKAGKLTATESELAY